ncbi:MAG: hypothetical protein KGR26_10395, partial [Cyanobacteria bacterium REEB65]|nr:hypothetical protein [Cyanobacteria bacterium REEB65]
MSSHAPLDSPQVGLLPVRGGLARCLLAVVAAQGLLAVHCLPAHADLVWVPEGRFFGHFPMPIQGNLPGAGDVNFDLVDARLGMRVELLPGLSVRGVGQVVNTGTSRYPLALRWGYVQYDNPAFGAVRLGQVPTVWSEREEQVVQDPLFGQGIVLSSGMLQPGALGASYLGSLDLASLGLGFAATASAEVGAYASDGLLGAGELTPNAVFPSYWGPGPSAAGRLSLAMPRGWSAHVFGRYGLAVDQQAGGALEWDGSGWHVVGEAIASMSTPVSSHAGEPALGEAMAADAGALLGARYNLGELSASLWKLNLIGRLGAISRNVTGAVRASESAFPVAPPSTDYTAEIGLEYAVNDSADVALDALILRQIQNAVSQSVSIGLRVGVQ